MIKPLVVSTAISLMLCGAFAQDGRGTILGRVTDSSSAAVPGAAIEVLQKATGVRLTSRSNDQGNYEMPFLLPGFYQLSVEAAGFKKPVRDDIEIRVGDRLKLDFTLELGQLAETVTVTGETPLVEASTATLGQVTDRRRIVDLPLSGGNAMTLLRLAPGITNTGTPNHPSLLRAVGAITSFTVDGTPAGSTQYNVDGAPAMAGSGPAFMPPAEMVEEFKVSTATYDASIGTSPGASISLILKSGTNQLHGSLYWFHNDIVLQGMDMFQRQQLYNAATGPVTHEKIRSVVPQHVINRYGGSAYGPVVLPKLYNGKNRTFWAYGFEGYIRPSVERGNWFFTVPTLKQRQGDFSELLPLGPTYQMYDPATTTPAPNGRFSRQPFAGNAIPKSRLNPLAVKLLDYWPAPNVAGSTDGRQNYFRPTLSHNKLGSHTGRIDHTVSQSQRLSGRFNYTNAPFVSSQVFPNQVTGNIEDRGNTFVGLDDVITLSPSMVLNLRANFTRYNIFKRAQGGAYDPAAAGFDPAFVATIDPQGRFVPGISINGYTEIGGVAPSINHTNYWMAGGDWMLIRGNHSVRAGAELRLYGENNYAFEQATPDISFGNAWTVGPLDNSPAAPIGQGMASYLLGIPTGGTMRVNASYAMQSKYTALFVHDDWKITRRLTLNLGLRHEYFGPVTERFDRTARGFDFTAVNPIDAAAAANYARNPIPEIPAGRFRSYGGIFFAGAGGQPRGLWESVYRNFSPRVGLAWQVAQATSVRAGYGIFFFPRGADRNGVRQTGYSRTADLVASEDNGRTFIASLANPFPRGPLPPLGSGGGLSTDTGNSVTFFNPALKFGYTQRWSVSLQRELMGRLVLDASYVGNRATRVSVDRQWDAVPAEYLSRTGERDQKTIDYLSARVPNPYYPLLPGTGLSGQNVARSQLLRPFPAFTGITGNEPAGYTWYHSLQLRAERRFSRGFTAQAAYTWSKWMNAISYLNPTDPMPEEVIAAQDRPQRFTFSGIYELPFGRGKSALLKHVLGDWQLQGLWGRAGRRSASET